MAYTDKTLVCRECNTEFVFTSGEQEFYEKHALQHEPTRCPTCRANRRRSRNSSDSSGPRETYKVICASCGKETEVPFQPRQGRPVYCQECFASIRTAR